jgi:hypothetical protein
MMEKLTPRANVCFIIQLTAPHTRNRKLGLFYTGARSAIRGRSWFVALAFGARLRRRFQKLKKQFITTLIGILSRRSRLHMGLGQRADLRANAQAKLDDATILLQNERFSNAYYLAGYAVEMALKACIAIQFSADTIPDKSFVNDVYSHDLQKLIKLAGLSAELHKQEIKDINFAANWALVAQWSESARYDSTDSMTAKL